MTQNILFEKPTFKHPEEKGLVSVIVPIYNDEIYLRETLNCILAQTFTNWEAVLVNDGSTDGSQKICEEYATHDPRFKVVNRENGGTLQARKSGLENSRGEYIANLDQDDTYHPEFLERMLGAIREKNADFVWCRFGGFPKGHLNNAVDYKWRKNPKENVECLFNDAAGRYHVLWNRLIRRSVYAEVEFPTANITYAEDPIQFLQIVWHSRSAFFVPLELYQHRVNSVISVTRSFGTFNKEKQAVHLIIGAFIMYKLSQKFDVKLLHIEKFSIPKSKSKYFLWLGAKKRAEYKYIYKYFPKKIRGRFPLNVCITLAEKGFVLPLKIYNRVEEFFN